MAALIPSPRVRPSDLQWPPAGAPARSSKFFRSGQNRACPPHQLLVARAPRAPIVSIGDHGGLRTVKRLRTEQVSQSADRISSLPNSSDPPRITLPASARPRYRHYSGYLVRRTLNVRVAVAVRARPRKAPLIGKVVGVGMVNEITDRTWVVVDAVDGRVHYADLGRHRAADVPVRDMLVALAGPTGGGEVRGSVRAEDAWRTGGLVVRGAQPQRHRRTSSAPSQSARPQTAAFWIPTSACSPT